MKSHRLIAASLALAAAFGLGLASSPSYARAPSVNDPNPHSRVISGWDQQQSVEYNALPAPQMGQSSVGVVERRHYVNSPACLFRCGSVHDTYYFTESRLSATYVDAFQRWILHTSDGDWYSFAPGASSGNRLAGKPVVDEPGIRSSVIDSADQRVVRGVSASGGQLLATFRYTHSLPYYDETYTTQELVQTAYVQLDSGPAYMAWIDQREYMVRPGSSQVELLSSKPVVQQGRQYSRSDYNDQVQSVDVVDVSGTTMTLRYTFTHDETFVADQYYVDRAKEASYDRDRNLWVLNIDGVDYAVAFDGDDTDGWNGTVVHAPRRFGRPQYVVPGTGGAVVPGRPTDEPAASGNDCIRGVNCPTPAAPTHGNDCIRGVNCPASAPPPKGNDCIRGVNC